jgi:3-hydroxybutyrate dehydrogenase
MGNSSPGLTKTVALETATMGITMNAICPGYVCTPLVQKQIPETATRGITEEQVINDVMLLAQPTKKSATIEQVAALAGFLASDIACSITGSNDTNQLVVGRLNKIFSYYRPQ